MFRWQHELDREGDNKCERTRERAEDREHQDHERQLDRERVAEHDRLLIEIQRETGAGIKQLHKDIANSPRFSHRGTPTSTPAADTRAADDHPKPPPL